MNNCKMPLCTVIDRHSEGGDIIFRLRLDAGSEIFRAHFPGNPVMPGACMVQTAVRLAADATGMRLRLAEIRSVKFLATVSPATAEEVEYRLTRIATDGGTVAFNAIVRCDGTTNAKMSLICKTQQEI